MHAHQLVRLLLCKPAEANERTGLADFVAVPNQHAGRVVLQFSDAHCFSVISSMPNATSMRVSVFMSTAPSQNYQLLSFARLAG